MTAMPIVTVRYFAAASEAAGREEEELTSTRTRPSAP
jgi:molybdopterin converting factor small subunit